MKFKMKFKKPLEHLCSTIPFFLPWIRMIVIPSDFPKSRLVVGDETDIRNVFGTLPIVQMGQYHTNGSSIHKWDSLIVDFRSDNHGISQYFVKSYIGRIPIITTLKNHMFYGVFGRNECDDFGKIHTSKRLVQTRPGGHTMDVKNIVFDPKLFEIRKIQDHWIFHGSRNR